MSLGCVELICKTNQHIHFEAAMQAMAIPHSLPLLSPSPPGLLSASYAASHQASVIPHCIVGTAAVPSLWVDFVTFYLQWDKSLHMSLGGRQFGWI